jgi:hypothetical protein
VDQTLEKIQGDQMMPIRDKDLYRGFDQKKIDSWNKELDEKYDPVWQHSCAKPWIIMQIIH